MDGDVVLAADGDGGVFGRTVGEEVESEDYGTVGRVLEGNDTMACGAR